jgi:hypothetical protein
MRSAIHKQNSLIARYCLGAVVLVGLLGPLAEIARGDFIIWNDEQLTVNSSHSEGILYDTSWVVIVLGGSVNSLTAWNSSTVGMSAGYVGNLYANNWSTVDMCAGSVGLLKAYDSTTVAISGGSVSELHASNSRTVDISGGSVAGLYAYVLSTVDISGGSVAYLHANNSSRVAISGGSVSNTLWASDSSTVAISGGIVETIGAYGLSKVDISDGEVYALHACDSSVVTFYGQTFRAGGALRIDGDRVLGTGLLAGEWMDGTRWTVNISENQSTATILAIPESEHTPFCVKYPLMDFTGDCKVDFSDLAVFLTHWLDCNLDPPSACWE